MRRTLRRGRACAVAALAVFAEAVMISPAAAQPPVGLTAVAGLTVGHASMAGRPTGCTVVLAAVNTVEKVHAVVLSGGSAFGLDAASGAVRYLDEHGIGFETEFGKVPIVPAAVLFDLNVGDPKIRPNAECGYRAAAGASPGPVAEGNVGAGSGATVGKLGGAPRAMRGGL
jgi:L-aminopeptidase/D-esterase-like protein